MLRVLLLAGAATQSRGLDVVEQRYGDRCLTGVRAPPETAGDPGAVGFELCDCTLGCSNIQTYQTTTKWDVSGGKMVTKGLGSGPFGGGEICFWGPVQLYPSNDLALAVCTEGAICTNLFGGCIGSRIDENGYWWTDDDRLSSQCIYLTETGSTLLPVNFILKSNQADCSPGFSRVQVPTSAYEII